MNAPELDLGTASMLISSVGSPGFGVASAVDKEHWKIVYASVFLTPSAISASQVDVQVSGGTSPLGCKVAAAGANTRFPVAVLLPPGKTIKFTNTTDPNGTNAISIYKEMVFIQGTSSVKMNRNTRGLYGVGPIINTDGNTINNNFSRMKAYNIDVELDPTAVQAAVVTVRVIYMGITTTIGNAQIAANLTPSHVIFDFFVMLPAGGSLDIGQVAGDQNFTTQRVREIII